MQKPRRGSKVPKQSERDPATRIKVQLDAKTFITVHSEAAFRTWKQRYPNATIV